MSEDVSAQVSDLIGKAKVFGSSENIRHGRYLFVIKRIFAQMVEIDKGNHKMAFWELTPLKAEPNPQSEGDRVDYVSPQIPGVGPLKDNGMNPNPVGSSCALKVDFDGPGGRSAPANIAAPILALFNKRSGEISEAELSSTWTDLSREKDLQVGDPIGISNGQVIKATAAKIKNPACGMVIAMATMAKKKKTPNDKGAYVTKMIWSCAAPIGTGENTKELIEKRRLEIESTLDDEAEESVSAPAAPAAAPGAGPFVAPQAPVAPPPPAAVAPPPPPAPSPWAPAVPWVKHPTAPGYYWSNPSLGGTNEVKAEAALKNGA